VTPAVEGNDAVGADGEDEGARQLLGALRLEELQHSDADHGCGERRRLALAQHARGLNGAAQPSRLGQLRGERVPRVCLELQLLAHQ
jgi:hypothetical protein